MAITLNGPIFLKSKDRSRGIKNKDFFAKHTRDIIIDVGSKNVI